MPRYLIYHKSVWVIKYARLLLAVALLVHDLQPHAGSLVQVYSCHLHFHICFTGNVGKGGVG